MLKFVDEDPSSNRAQWALAEYIRDVTQTAGLTQLDLQAGVRDVAEYRAPTGVFLLGLFDEEAVACIGLRRRNDVEAEIKRMWVSPLSGAAGWGRLCWLRWKHGRLNSDTRASCSTPTALSPRP